MRTFLGKTAIMVLIVGCASLSHRTRSVCFAPARLPAESTSRGPEWMRLRDVSTKDSGAVSFGLANTTAGAGRWWRTAPDSVRIAAHGHFDVLAMRAAIRGDSIVARFTLTTDVLRDSAGVLMPISHIGEWIGRRRSCRGL